MAIFNSVRAVALLAAVYRVASGVVISVSNERLFESSPILYGFMFEDINHSGDGGIHGQLLRNNGLQGPDDETKENGPLTAYNPIGGVTLSADAENPLTSAITRTVRVDVLANATGKVGFSNDGYYGLPVQADTYANYFWIKGDFDCNITLALQGKTSGDVFGSGNVAVTSNSSAFTYVDTSFDATLAPNGDNVWALTFDAAEVAGKSLWFGLVQLFPTTYKERYNGLNPRQAGVLEDMQGSFLRFPGGNNLEGLDEQTRWKWNETVGPVENRPGRLGTWAYTNTDALGLLEYIYWCEDMKLEPILDVYAGFALESGGNTPFTGDALKPYIREVMDQLEYLTAGGDSGLGALRAQHGHPAAVPLRYVEIGNEDMLGGGCESYPERFMAYYDAIHDAYRDLTIIASTVEPECLPDPLPEGVWLDYHDYNSPQHFVDLYNYWDNQDRNVPIVVGEFATNGTDWPTMNGSAAEAVFMIGIERNSDVVKMAAYAPLLQLVPEGVWVPDLISFTPDPNSMIRSTSYWVQHMFSTNRGEFIMNSTGDAAPGPVYWVASSRSDGTYFVKMASYIDTEQIVTVTIPGKSAGTLTLLTGNPQDSNTDVNPNLIVPTTRDVNAPESSFSFMMPPFSVAVLAAP